MTSHVAELAGPKTAIRVRELAETGLSGRHSRRRSDFRTAMREMLTSAPGRHRRTFIPLDTYLARTD